MAQYVVSWERAPHYDESSADRFGQLFAVTAKELGVDRAEFLPCIDGTTGFIIVETDDPGLIHRQLLTFSGLLRYRVHPVTDFEGLQTATAWATAKRAEASQ